MNLVNLTKEFCAVAVATVGGAAASAAVALIGSSATILSGTAAEVSPQIVDICAASQFILVTAVGALAAGATQLSSAMRRLQPDRQQKQDFTLN